MPRVTRRAKSRGNYTEQERRVLLTGVPVSAASTRFGHPFAGTGWNVDEIRTAWELLKAELSAEWLGAEFEYYRKRHSSPFAERLLLEYSGRTMEV